MTASNDQIPAGRPPDAPQGFVRRNGLPVAAIVAVTVLVETACWLLARRSLPPVTAATMTLWMALLWTMVAAPVFAAGGTKVIDAFARGGVVADAGVVVLVLLAWQSPAVGGLGAVKIYLLWVAVVLAECAIVALGRRAATRHVLAVAVATVLLILSASPFWTGPSVMAAAKGDARHRAAGVSVAVNPVFATTAQLSEGYRFRWQEQPLLYEHTVLGRDVLPMPSPGWYVTAGTFAAAAGAAIAAAIIRRRC